MYNQKERNEKGKNINMVKKPIEQINEMRKIWEILPKYKIQFIKIERKVK